MGIYVLCIKLENFIVYGCEMGLMFFNEFRFKGVFMVMRCIEFKFIIFGFNLFIVFIVVIV